MIRLALRCRAEEAGTVLAELLEVAPSGVEEVSAPGGREGVVEFAVYGAPGELPDIGAFEAHAGEALVEVLTEEVPDDWDERWKRFYFPVLVGGRIYVRPPWEQPAQRGGVEEVVIDPGGAFGTGTHPTTRMCLELMLQTPVKAAPAKSGRRDSRSFCDLGCGSGVLSIAAAKLGFEPVLGVDADRAAIEESDRNARANYVELELRHMDLRREAPPVADVAAANLTAPLLEAVARAWTADERPGTLIASGVLREEVDRVAAVLAEAGFGEERRLVSGDWAALVAS